MKKTIVILTAISLLSTSAMAQKTKKASSKNFSWGVQFGYQASSALTTKYNGTSKTYDATSKLMFGVVTNFKLNNNFSIQPELNYGTEGSKPVVYPFSIRYINIPVLAKYTFNSSTFSLIAGPQIGFKTSVEGINYITYVDDNGNTVEPTALIKSTQIEGVIGAGYQFNFGLNLGLRYQMGLSNIANSSMGSTKSNLFGIIVGYNFN